MATYSTKALPVMQLYPKKQETRFTEASATDSVGSWLVPPKGLALLGPAPTKPSEIRGGTGTKASTPGIYLFFYLTTQGEHSC